MERYLIFTYRTYYPFGGMEDFICSIDSLDNLKEILKESKDDMFHVYDILKNEYVIEETYINDYFK
jgi:hypothetical protein